MTVDELKADYPAWHIWQGVNGMWYARRRIGISNVTVSGDTLGALETDMARWDKAARW